MVRARLERAGARLLRQLGAQLMDEWLTLRLIGEPLEQLAARVGR